MARAISRLMVASLIFIGFRSHGQIFMVDEGRSFVDQNIQQRTIGIEVEFEGLTDQQIKDVVQKHFPESQISGDIAAGIKVQTHIGQMRIVIEGSAWRYEADPARYAEQKKRDIIEAPREIVFPPVNFSEIPSIHALIENLDELKAKGTSEDRAVSLQVNLQMKKLKNRRAVRDVLNLMRTYYKPEHRAQIEPLLRVPKKRIEFVLDPSPGFMKRLNDPAYDPTPRQLYDDYFYRQSLELKGRNDAWMLPLNEVKAALLQFPGEDAIVPQVVKMQKLRISSLLLLEFPDDPFTRRVLDSRWARPAPIIEFREFNNDFDTLSKVRMTLGLARTTELFGTYDHDTLFSDLTGISKTDIQRLRTGYNQGKSIVRYVLQDPKTDPLTSEDRGWLSRLNPRTMEIQLDADHTGSLPLQLADGTIVWHRRNIHRSTLLGQYNPGLENYLMQQALENKLFEAFIFEKYAPGAFPSTVAYNKIIHEKTNNVEKIFRSLSQKFPKGWVLKGAWDFSSEKIIVTDKIDFNQAMKDYRAGFETYRKKIEKKYGGSDPEAVLYYLKKHKGFIAYKILQLLKNPDLLLVQQRRSLVEEFRVETLGGKVLGQGSTIPRFAWMKKKKTQVPQHLIQSAEAFVQKIIDRLPPELQSIPYGFDAALTAEGDWVLIESNPGGNSSFLEENPASSRALTAYLEMYPRLVESMKGLLKPEQQIQWIREHLAEFGMSLKKSYPGMTFTSNDIIDPEFNDGVTKLPRGAQAPCIYLMRPGL